MAQVVWLARHGNRLDFVDPEWFTTAGRPYDPPLSPDGIEQSRALAERLRGEEIAHIFASPFLRAVQTANQVAEVIDLPIKIETGFSEWLNPDWFPAPPECLSARALAARFARVDPVYASRVLADYPETGEQSLRRAGEAARLVTQEFAGGVLIVGHGASVVGAASGLLGVIPEIHVGFCSLAKISRKEDRWVLDLAGDTAHLDHTEAQPRFH
jgi:broad specificity phosphatase PhoE